MYLTSHTIKLWEGTIEYGLRHETTILNNQIDFMPKRSIMEVIFLLRRLMEKYR